MRELAVAVTTDPVALSAQLQGLGLIERPDRNGWCPVLSEPLIRRCAEQSDRRDVVGDLRRQRPGDHIGGHTGRYGGRRDVAGQGRALRISAEHLFGLGAVRRHGLDMRARVADPVDDGPGEIGAAEIRTGLIVHRVHPKRPAADVTAERVGKWSSDAPHAGWLTAAACEDHFDVGTRVCRRRRDRQAEQRGCRRGRPCHSYR